MSETLPDERVLEDDYPVYAGYIYLADGDPFVSPLTGTVVELKRRVGAVEIRRCNIVKRKIRGREVACV